MKTTDQEQRQLKAYRRWVKRWPYRLRRKVRDNFMSRCGPKLGRDGERCARAWWLAVLGRREFKAVFGLLLALMLVGCATPTPRCENTNCKKRDAQAAHIASALYRIEGYSTDPYARKVAAKAMREWWQYCEEINR